MAPKPKPIEERFWNLVDRGNDSACWNWLGTKPTGYGGMKINGVVRRAHRVSWELHFGQIPDDLCVLHRCDNPACVNPDHLYLGTVDDNNRDCRLKGRHGCGRTSKPGESNPRARLNKRNIKKIFALRKRKLSQQAIADQFGISQAQISRILRKQSWADV